MKFIDTHSHLYSDKFNQDRVKVVADSIEMGVDKILLPNISSKFTQKMLALCRLFPKNCFPMMGLHPCDVTEDNYDFEISHVEKELNTQKYIGVGEIGLDLYWDKTNLEIQKKAFIHQVKLAKQHQLPIAIHVRNSFNQAIEIIEDLNDSSLKGVFHCFTGSLQEANRVLRLGGFYLGIGGVLTFKNSGLDKVIEQVDINSIILETDSPYLAPTPFRGKRNESKHIINIAQKLAETHNVELEIIAEYTTKNAKNLFKI